MTARPLGRGTAAALVAWSALVAAQPASPTRQAVEQKEKFVSRLLDDSPVARRIANGANTDAKAFFASALDQHRRAREQMESGDLAAADKTLNDALWSAGKARQLAPDSAQRLIAERVRYARLLDGVVSLRHSYERQLQRPHRGASPPPLDDALVRADALIDDARSLSNAERMIDANRALEDAERGLLSALNRTLGSATLRYDEKFDSPLEEFEFESNRNASYADLVPVALHEYRPSADQIRAVARHVERHQSLREQALQLAVRKDFRAALRAIRSATAELQRALGAAGLVLPGEQVADRKE